MSKVKFQVRPRPRDERDQPPSRKIPFAEFARIWGVSTRTLDRWIEQKILPEPERINSRKYFSSDVTPRHDVEHDAA
jgi:hypothetical protein